MCYKVITVRGNDIEGTDLYWASHRSSLDRLADAARPRFPSTKSHRIDLLTYKLVVTMTNNAPSTLFLNTFLRASIYDPPASPRAVFIFPNNIFNTLVVCDYSATISFLCILIQSSGLADASRAGLRPWALEPSHLRVASKKPYLDKSSLHRPLNLSIGLFNWPRDLLITPLVFIVPNG